MLTDQDWWIKPRRVSIVVDNDSWVIPWAEKIVTQVRNLGDDPQFVATYDAVTEGAVAIFLGCVRIAPADVVRRNRRNVVIHESNLPEGRGFSPLTWQIISGKNTIPVCLINASERVDEGGIIYRAELSFAGNELIAEMRDALGQLYVDLVLKFLSEPSPPPGEPQRGEPSYFMRRRPADSRLDPHLSIAAQFDLLRTVDNERYPAFFEHRGRTFRLKIEAMDRS